RFRFFKLNDSTSIDDDLLSNVKLDSDVEANGVDEGDINDNNDSADPEASQKLYEPIIFFVKEVKN
ncbi:13684_t:CDS:1, partial [Entrophospora sp. SA101]